MKHAFMIHLSMLIKAVHITINSLFLSKLVKFHGWVGNLLLQHILGMCCNMHDLHSPISLVE